MVIRITEVKKGGINVSNYKHNSCTRKASKQKMKEKIVMNLSIVYSILLKVEKQGKLVDFLYSTKIQNQVWYKDHGF